MFEFFKRTEPNEAKIAEKINKGLGNKWSANTAK